MNAEDLAYALGAKRSGRQWKCRCVAHEDSNPSMIIFDGREAVQVRCMAGCEPQDIIAVLRSRGLWEGSEQQETPEPVKRERSLKEQQREQRMRILARGIFDEAKPILGTVAERYFDSRDLLSVARMITDIRFHPRCPRGSGDHYREQPAVVIAMRSITTNAVTAIQRIFLTRQARKDGAMMLGSAGGAAMKLQLLQNHSLHVCEGVETGLAILAMDYGPVWALGSAVAVENFPLLDTVDDLTIWADTLDTVNPHTGKRPGEDAAAKCARRWSAAGKDGRTFLMENNRGLVRADAADMWRSRNGRV
jgi:hypothetical protein